MTGSTSARLLNVPVRRSMVQARCMSDFLTSYDGAAVRRLRHHFDPLGRALPTNTVTAVPHRVVYVTLPDSWY